LTIHYGEDDLSGSREESQLALWLWQDNFWQDPKLTCGSPADYTQDTERNILTLPICQPGSYALFTPSYPTFFPTILSMH
jgi:hypothetical protein